MKGKKQYNKGLDTYYNGKQNGDIICNDKSLIELNKGEE